MTPHARDDGFHEIQLNGKQLVFLFMAATVVSVVVFLCGVLVGRGVPTPAPTETASSEPAAPPALGAPHQTVATPAGSDPTAAAAPPPADDLSYFDRLGGQQPAAEALGSAGKGATRGSKPPANAPAQTAPPQTAAADPPKSAGADPPSKAAVASPKSAPSATPAAPPATAFDAPSGPGFALQVAALKVRDDAEAVAKRLTTKGYSAYVLMPAAGASSVYRVRVGKFKTRKEAQAVAVKLRKEEKFKPWITR